MAVGADAQWHARRQPAAQVGQAVAQVGLGAGADHHARAAAGHGGDLARLRMGGVHQLPALVQQALAHQPFDGPHAGGGQAVVHLGGLLGHVDVDGAVEVLGQVLQLVDGGRRRSAQ